ncbi:MAG: lytic transglycosylase domain-containing protein [Desulfobacteraceae bacterium]|nr:lytic transglycosylase domain-containing protein [Desulfobacteraceae bacterium]
MKKYLHILLLFVLFLPAGASAEMLYTYIDSNGVLNFTNVITRTDSEMNFFVDGSPGREQNFYTTSKFDSIIRKASSKYGVDFSLVKAVIKVESDFNPRAVSRKGASGLMQIMPFNFQNFYVSDPFDPVENIMGGTYYLGKLIRKYENRLPLVLAAYNAGPTTVDTHQDIPPFRETQRYVKKVMKAYNIYKGRI